MRFTGLRPTPLPRASCLASQRVASGEIERSQTTGGTAGPRWIGAPDGEWARPIVATLFVLLLLGIPHHRLFIWLSDSSLVKYWKEIAFAVGCLTYAWVVVRRRGLTRTEWLGLMWAAPFVTAALIRLVVGAVRHEDQHLLFVGGGSHLYYVPIFLLTIYLLESSRRDLSGRVEKALYWVLIATTLAAVLSILDNLFHISGHFDFFARTRVEARLDYDPNVWRSSATYQSPMVLGMIAGTGLLLSLFFFVTRLSKRPRLWGQMGVFGLLVVLHVVGLYLTFSRGPLVAAAAGATLICLFGNSGLDWRKAIANWRQLAVGVVGAGLTLALVIVLLPEPLQRHLGSIVDWTQDQNNVTRLRRISWGLERVREAPWIGHGLGSAQQRLADYRIQELDGDFNFTNPESQLLSYAMEGGIMLLIPALLIAGFMIHTAIAMASSPERTDLRRLGVLFLGLQAALYAESLIMPILDTRIFQLGFWVLFGVLVRFRGELRQPVMSTAEPGIGTESRAGTDRP